MYWQAGWWKRSWWGGGGKVSVMRRKLRIFSVDPRRFDFTADTLRYSHSDRKRTPRIFERRPFSFVCARTARRAKRFKSDFCMPRLIHKYSIYIYNLYFRIPTVVYIIYYSVYTSYIVVRYNARSMRVCVYNIPSGRK